MEECEIWGIDIAKKEEGLMTFSLSEEKEETEKGEEEKIQKRNIFTMSPEP